jgi:hypothetical protein
MRLGENFPLSLPFPYFLTKAQQENLFYKDALFGS